MFEIVLRKLLTLALLKAWIGLVYDIQTTSSADELIVRVSFFK